MNSTRRPWFAFYTGEYLEDTSAWPWQLHAPYLLLRLHYWRHEGLPPDDASLARICRMSPDEWAAYRPMLAPLFGIGWKCAAWDDEIARTKTKMENLSAGRLKREKPENVVGFSRKPGREHV